MKIKKEVYVEICDFCGEEKKRICSICGKDLCGKHSLSLERWLSKIESVKRSGWGVGIIFGGVPVISGFCLDHLSAELREHYESSLK